MKIAIGNQQQTYIIFTIPCSLKRIQVSSQHSEYLHLRAYMALKVTTPRPVTAPDNISKHKQTDFKLMRIKIRK